MFALAAMVCRFGIDPAGAYRSVGRLPTGVPADHVIEGERGMPSLNLKEVEKRLGKSSIAITIADMTAPDAPIVFANEAFLTLTEYESQEVIGRNCRFLQDGSNNLAARDIIGEALELGLPAQATLRNRKKGGDRFDNLLFLEPLFDKSQDLVYFVGSQFPLTAKSEPKRATLHANHLVREIEALLKMNSKLQASTRASLARNSAAAVRLWLDRS